MPLLRLTLTLLLAQTLDAPVLHMGGLERLYFKHILSSDLSSAPRSVVALLPEAIESTSSSSKADKKQVTVDGIENETEVRDFALSIQGRSKRSFIRQIVVSRETARINELWWALYDDGRRSDVWYFEMDPQNNDHKVLSNYAIDSVSASEHGLELRIHGEMFRPQGAWWITGKVFTFSASGDSLSLWRVRNDYGFFRGYDMGDAPPAIDVTTERETDKDFEIRTYDAVPNALLKRCGFRDPHSEETGESSWKELERTASCMTSNSRARVSHRGFDEPSFVERGGKAAE